MTLFDVVRRLATSHPDTVVINGEKIPLIRRPLLIDLEDAGTASTASRSGSVPGPKLPIDSDAVDLAKHIRGELTGDLIRLGVRRFKLVSLPRLLLTWHGNFTATGPSGAEIAAWIEQLEAWETSIRALVEPEKRMPVMGEPCPLCGNTRHRDGDDTMTALWIAFSEDAPEASTRLECKACSEVLASGSKAVAAVLRISATHQETA